MMYEAKHLLNGNEKLKKILSSLDDFVL